MDRFSLPVSLEPERDFVHTQKFSEYLTLNQDGEQCDDSRYGQAQLQICDMNGKERKNPFCFHANRGGRTHTLERNANLRLPKVW